VLLHLPVLDDLGATNISTAFRIKQEVAEKLKLPLVDPSGRLRAGGSSLYLEADPVHLNAHGNEIIARELFESIRKLSFLENSNRPTGVRESAAQPAEAVR